MTRLHGFLLEREDTLQEYHATARLWRHERTGARFLSLCNGDDNKVFAVTFRTPPRDSTGVAHILEHSVLCGSRKYPVKEPFVELMKGSLQTFLNAFTYPDKTCYPVASTHAKDFYNLMDVYLDAVFFPRITRDIFMQEGWHFTRPVPDGPLARKGVVLNEMKGAYSSADSVFREACQHALFPDTLYGLDSGGDPAVIPSLTYEAFREFHATWYHPANAWFFGYGDDPEPERLRRVAEYVDQFEPLAVDSAIPLQTPFQEPRAIRQVYACDEDGDARSMVALNWLLDEPLAENSVEAASRNLAWHILDELLVGLPGAPLRQALLDSGLGEDLAGVGLESELRQMYFSTGLKGIQGEDAPKVEALVLETLETLATQGFTPESVAAAMNTVEFDLRENNTGSYPRGLNLMLRGLASWLHDKDPLALIAFEAPLTRLKYRLAQGERVFEDMVRHDLLDNRCRATVLLDPDPALEARRAAEEAAELDAITARFSPAELEEIAREAEALERQQETPDPPEALALLPHLAVADLPRENQVIPMTIQTMEEATVISHPLDTSGIVYLDLGFTLEGLSPGLLPFVPLFSRALLETGAGERDFVSLAMHIAATTGGIGAQPYAATRLGEVLPAQYLFLRGKATLAQLDGFLDILRDVLLHARLLDRERLRQLILEEKAGLEESLVPSGHMYVLSRLRAGLNQAGKIAETMEGLEQLFFLRKLADKLDASWPALEQALMALKQALLVRPGCVVNVTAEPEALARLEPGLRKLLRDLPSLHPRRDGAALLDLPLPPGTQGEALTIPAQVNYVGLAVDLHAGGYAPHGVTQLASRFLRSGYLWEKVRVQGGAYGAFCGMDRLSGAMSLVSYRDPNLARTLETFQRLGDYLAELELSPAAMEKAVIGAINDLDAYMLPDAKGFVSTLRHLTNDAEPVRQRLRQEVLGATVEHLRQLGRHLQKALPGGRICVLGGKSALEGLARERDWALRQVM